MDKTQAAVVLVVFGSMIGIVGAVFGMMIYAPQATTPEAQDELSTVDDWMSELDGFIDFENQTFDFDLGNISGDWD